MKKTIFCLVAVMGLITACDPIEDRKSFDAIAVTENDIIENFSYVQTDASGNESSMGNYFTFTCDRIVTIFNYASDGSESILSYGTSAGSFTISPKRGSDENQSFYVRVVNSDGTSVQAQYNVTVTVPADMSTEMKLLVSDSGTKTWKWNTNSASGYVWGNMGYCDGAGSDVALNANGIWWGVSSEEEFLGQLMHSNTGEATGEESMDAYMIMDEDGLIKTYAGDGTLVRSGSFTIENFDNSDPDAWKVGDLITTEGSILWPFEINSGGNMPTQFDIVYLTTDQMVLVYPDGGDFDGLGNWGEATFWDFASTSDVQGNFESYDTDGKMWTWNTEAPSGYIWGNMGYCGGDGSEVYLYSNGIWWGVSSEEEFLEQLQHSNTGEATGEESLDAYMLVNGDLGTISTYAGDGTYVRGGSYTLEATDGNEWKVADLKTDAGTILWPFEINSGGNMPTQFEVVYLTSSVMTLVYPDGGDFDGLSNWGEATFWNFKVKE